jgi:transcriptional regulator with XRE-family HTH domain
VRSRAKRPLPREARQLGRRVAQLRKAKGWTQERLAEASGMDVSHLAALEVGLVNPTLVTLLKVAKGLRVKVGELFEF